MSLLKDVKEEINNKKIKTEKIPQEVKEMLEEVFAHNDAVGRTSERIPMEWVQGKLRERGYIFGRYILRNFAVQLGRRSWGQP